jgi:hypothetical protein
MRSLRSIDVQALLPHADVITRATHVRSTLLQTSLRMVEQMGNYERWFANVDPLYRAAIIESVAPTWLPIEAGLAHYMACDALDLDDAALDKIGQGVGEKLQTTLMGVAAKMARSSGLSPEIAAASFGKLWPRLCQGGSFQVTKPGPKDMTIELRSAVMTKSRYFRGTFIGNVRAAIKLLGTRALYIKQLPYDEKSDTFTVQVSYV